MSHNEKFGFSKDGNLKSITYFCLETLKNNFFLMEKDIINSFAISPNDDFLLLNTGKEIPELHLWNIETK